MSRGSKSRGWGFGSRPPFHEWLKHDEEAETFRSLRDFVEKHVWDKYAREVLFEGIRTAAFLTYHADDPRDTRLER